ncbi:MAG TPA: RNA polymerase sigma factor [Acidimicrobiia bacterium]|nr:RNA polymerase sigma factor [Acidimicrobiia bacterium]
MHPPPFELLLGAHRARLHRYLVVLVGPTDAADCLQEASLSALAAYPPADTDHLSAWLFTIAHRKGLDVHRRRARQRRLVATAAHDGHATLPDVELWDAVARLPDKQRAAVTLRYAADLPYAEIATVLDVSEDAARQNVRAGLRGLRRAITDTDALTKEPSR